MRIKLDRTNLYSQAHRATLHISDYDLQWTILASTLLVLDTLAVLGSLNFAYTVRIGWLTYSAPHDVAVYRMLSLLSLPIWLIVFALSGLYRRDTLLGGVGEYKLAAQGCTVGILALIVLSFMWRNLGDVSRGWLVLSWALSCGAVILERFLARRAAYQLRRHGWFTARVLIVGANDQGIAMARQWYDSPNSGMQVVGFVDDFKSLGTPVFDGLKVIGRPTALGDLARHTGAHEVIMVPNAVAWETFEEIIAHASTSNGYILRLSPGFYEMLATNVVVTNKSFVPLFTIDDARVVGIEAVLKTLLDYGLGVPLLMLTSPLMFLIAIGLQLTRSGEPVLTHHQTVGQGGMTFEMLKFNTRISPDAKTGSRVHTMLAIGSSVSWLEQALYRTGLDKLPQLLNVLVGQMSLVGPRPRVIDEEADPQMVRNLQTVKPGILGPWATAEHWTSGDEIQDELYYVRNWTIWLDLQVLFDTLVSWMPGIRRARPIVTRQPRGRRSPHPPGLASKPHGSKARTALSPVLSKLGEGPKSYQHYDSTKNMGKRF